MDFKIFESKEQNELALNLFNAILAHIDEAALITENNKIIFTNNKFIDYTGYTKEEILKMSPLDFVHPDFLAMTKKNMLKKSETPYEIWAIRKDKSQFPVLLKPKMVKHHEKIFRIVAIKDLTQVKQYIHREQLLSTTLDQSHESVVITDANATIIYVNQQFCKLTGYTSKEAIGENPNILQSGNHSKKFYKNMWAILTSGKIWKGEFQNKKKNGKLYWEKATIIPIFDDNRKIKSYLGIKVDITKQKKIEQNFKDAEIKYHELIKNSPLGVVTIDTQGNIIIINKKMTDFLGSPSIEATKKLNVLTFPLLKAASVSEQFQNCIDYKKKIRFENKYTSKWGKTIYYRLYLSPILNNNNVVTGILGIAEDISKEKQYEEDILEAKEKAEESDSLKNIFLANMSHELRTPLNAIIGFDEILKDNDNFTQEQKEYLEYIESSANHLLSIINDLVDVSQLSSHQLNYTLGKIKVCEIVEPLIPVLRQQLVSLHKEHIDLIIHPYKEDIKGIVLNTDKNRFSQIIINLVNNAIKFTDEGKIEISCNIKNNDLVVSVNDTGIGIPKDKQEIIFERFRQVEEKLSRRYEGSGLGLSLVKDIVSLLNGKVWVESEVGKGSTFYVSFPIVKEDEEHQKEKPDKKSFSENFKNDKFTVLVVEDNQQNKILIGKILQQYNFNIVEASNGKEAIDILNKTPYINVILMDLQMPVMDGIEATKIIRQTNSTIPIIAQTALALPEDKEKALSAGCNDVLVKPFVKDQLLLKIIDNLKVS